MNKLTGNISQIQKSGSIILVDVDVNGQCFSALLIESATPPEWLQAGNSIDLVFKETEVSLAKDLTGKISLRNRMSCSVLQTDKGVILSTIRLAFQNFTITSAITTRSLESLQISAGDKIEALVKSNEVSLMKKYAES
jgi:molybdopterin-binding protein